MRRMGGLSRRALLACTLGASTWCVPGRARAQRARSLVEGLRGALDASQEGLVPGAADDQSALLTQALGKAEAAGQALFLPPGRYEISEVELPARTQLIGVPGETRLAFRGGAFMLRARHAERLRMEGVTIDGLGLPLDDATALLDADTIADLRLDDCEFSASSAGAISLRTCAGRVERSRIAGARTIGLDLMQSRGMAVLDNVIADCGDTGIFVGRDEEGADDTVVRGNRVSFIRAASGGTGQYGNGINLAKANGVIVADNRIDDCAFSAIRCFSSDDFQVTGNIATRSGEVAIYVEFAYEGAIVANNLIDDAAYGISFANLMTYGGRLAVCSGNLIRNVSGVPRLPRGDDALVGAGIGAEADIAITGNVIDNAQMGLELGWGEYLRNVAATGNVIRGCPIGVGVTVVEGAGAAVIASNLISGAESGAILGMRWAEVVTGDLAAAGAEAFPHLTIQGNSVS
jgi:uncharacterized secreted repeat protein (TIGR03808 family)